MSRPLSTRSLQALSWLVIENSLGLSHGCECVVEAVRVLYTLAASLGSPAISLGTLMASAGTFMASTTLTWPTLILMGPCKHSHQSSTVSRPLVAFTRAIQALSLPLQALHSHRLRKHSVVRSCQFFFKIYTFTAHIVQKHFKGHERAFIGHVSAFGGCESAFRVCENVCKVRESTCKGHKSTCRGSLSACIARENASRGLETVAEAWECLQGPLWYQQNCNKSTNIPISKLRIETKLKRFDVFQNLKGKISIYPKICGTKPNLFDVFQLFLQKQNVTIKSKNLETKTKRFELVHKFLKTKQNFLTFCSLKKIWKLNKSLDFGSKISRSEREHFGSIINFFFKTKIFWVFW